MAELSYETLDFSEDSNRMRVNLLKRFYFYIDKQELQAIAPFKISPKNIQFDCPKQRAERRFSNLIDSKIQNLKTIVTHNPAVYIHKNSRIPLIGNLSFGIIYRGSSIIELKPQTSCNLDCVYCSVNEGLSSNQTDYLVELDYLMAEFKKLSTFINQPVEAHIGIQGEPFVYTEFADLVHDLSKLDSVYRITTDTNGTTLHKKLIDKLAKYPKLRINISLNAVDKDIASKMAGANYNVQHVMDMIRYAADRMDIIVAPLYVPGYNDGELIKIVEFAKTLPKKDYPIVCIQNFLSYKSGRNPTKVATWDAFYAKLKDLETKTGTKLIVDKSDFEIEPAKDLPKPFKKNNIISATIIAPGRYPKTRIAAAQDRNITVFGSTSPLNKEVRLKIIRSKHNIFFAKEL